MIWNCAEVEDIYNFSTVSKRVYHLVREALREHCKLSKRLSTISNVGTECGEPGLFGPILKEILLNPRAARYPSLLEIGIYKLQWDKDGEHARRMVPESDLDLFKQAVRANIDDTYDDIEDDWFASINEGDEEPLIALLLLLLPNLRRVRLDSTAESGLCIEQALRTIMDHEDSASLRKLHTVDLRRAATTDSDFLDFNFVRLFAGLPSVAGIYGRGVGTCPEDLFCTPYIINYPTDVISLSFWRCCIDPKSLFEFLSFSTNLQHFYYIPMEPASDTADFDPFWIRTALLAHAHNTLKTLTILAGEHETSFMGSLDVFTSLESVQTDLQLLMGDPSMTLRIACQMLPSSIVNLRLHIDSPSDDACCKDIIENIIDMPKYFHRLQEFNIIGVADVQAAEQSHESLIKVLAERHIKVSFEADKSLQDIENEFNESEVPDVL